MEFRGSQRDAYKPPPPRKATKGAKLVNFIQVVIILSLLRLVMLQYGVFIIDIPFVDDGFRYILNNGLSLLRQWGLVGSEYYS